MAIAISSTRIRRTRRQAARAKTAAASAQAATATPSAADGRRLDGGDRREPESRTRPECIGTEKAAASLRFVAGLPAGAFSPGARSYRGPWSAVAASLGDHFLEQFERTFLVAHLP